MKEEILEYLEQFMFHTNWDDENTPEQARSLFTTICLMENIDADTSECDKILSHLYWLSELEEIIEYEDFVNFMVKDIV